MGELVFLHLKSKTFSRSNHFKITFCSAMKLKQDYSQYSSCTLLSLQYFFINVHTIQVPLKLLFVFLFRKSKLEQISLLFTYQPESKSVKALNKTQTLSTNISSIPVSPSAPQGSSVWHKTSLHLQNSRRCAFQLSVSQCRDQKRSQNSHFRSSLVGKRLLKSPSSVS